MRSPVPISDPQGALVASGAVRGVYQFIFAAKTSSLSQCLLRGGDVTPVDFTYAFWAVLGEFGVVLVDSGFGQDVARRRGITYQRRPVEALAALGVSATDVTDVVLTHLHFDHAGGLVDFPAARIHLQRSDLSFYTGPYMRFPQCSGALEQADLGALSRAEAEGRLNLLDGGARLGEGIVVHHVGGHTPGSQVVDVTTEEGRVVLASDVAHLYDNLASGTPFPVLHDLPSCCQAFETVSRFAEAGAVVVPGHDGRVMDRFPRVEGDGSSFVVRLI